MLRGAADIMEAGIPPNTAWRTLYQTPNTARYTLYWTYIGAVHGYLDRGNRVVMPICVRDFICYMFPDAAGEYMGHTEVWMNEFQVGEILMYIPLLTIDSI